LKHENVVAYDDCGLHEEILFYTMELVPWGSLADVLARKRHLPWRDVVACGIDICRGLEHLHQTGIVHRDLKPANIFLSDDGRLKLGDFGLARDLGAVRLTIDGQTVGTAKYLAPEQAMAKPDIDGRTDLYALGCILFELLAGRPPFVNDDPYAHTSYFQLMEKHVEEPPPRVTDFVKDCPDSLSNLIDQLLAKSPAQRPSSAGSLIEALTAILADPQAQLLSTTTTDIEAPTTTTPSLTERLQADTSPAPKVNTRALIVIIGLAALGLIGLLLISRR
jgi:serine/threonine protein kinase